MIPPMAGPTARARFWLTAPSEMACRRSAAGTSSGCSVCQVGEVRAWPVPTAKINARSTQGVTNPANGECAERDSCHKHQTLRDQQEATAIDQIAQRAGEDGEEDHREARRRLDEGDVSGRRGQRDHQPLRGHRLHPPADVADELCTPHGGESLRMERSPRRALRGRLCGPLALVSPVGRLWRPGRVGRVKRVSRRHVTPLLPCGPVQCWWRRVGTLARRGLSLLTPEMVGREVAIAPTRR